MPEGLRIGLLPSRASGSIGAVPKPSDIRPIGAALHFLPVQTRVPLKFGPETLTTVTCARVRVRVVDAAGRTAEGWGETPLSVQWVWPSSAPCAEREEALQRFCVELTGLWAAIALRVRAHFRARGCGVRALVPVGGGMLWMLGFS